MTIIEIKEKMKEITIEKNTQLEELQKQMNFMMATLEDKVNRLFKNINIGIAHSIDYIDIYFRDETILLIRNGEVEENDGVSYDTIEKIKVLMKKAYGDTQ